MTKEDITQQNVHVQAVKTVLLYLEMRDHCILMPFRSRQHETILDGNPLQVLLYTSANHLLIKFTFRQ